MRCTKNDDKKESPNFIFLLGFLLCAFSSLMVSCTLGKVTQWSLQHNACRNGPNTILEGTIVNFPRAYETLKHCNVLTIFSTSSPRNGVLGPLKTDGKRRQKEAPLTVVYHCFFAFLRQHFSWSVWVLKRDSILGPLWHSFNPFSRRLLNEGFSEWMNFDFSVEFQLGHPVLRKPA